MVVECLLYLLVKENWRIVVVANIPRVESQRVLSLVAEDLIPDGRTGGDFAA
jgi:hypothetical protein